MVLEAETPDGKRISATDQAAKLLAYLEQQGFLKGPQPAAAK